MVQKMFKLNTEQKKWWLDVLDDISFIAFHAAYVASGALQLYFNQSTDCEMDLQGHIFIWIGGLSIILKLICMVADKTENTYDDWIKTHSKIIQDVVVCLLEFVGCFFLISHLRTWTYDEADRNKEDDGKMFCVVETMMAGAIMSFLWFVDFWIRFFRLVMGLNKTEGNYCVSLHKSN